MAASSPVDVRIAPARGEGDLGAIAALFADYAASLPVDLGYQDFASELAALPGKYAPPGGELLLARGSDGAPLGCVGIRPLGAGIVEMKRLYVSPAARGLGLGRLLTDAAIDWARGAGHSALRLDTLPTMTAAIAMYRARGFQPIAPYYGPVPDGTLFLELALNPSAADGVV